MQEGQKKESQKKKHFSSLDEAGRFGFNSCS